MHEQEEERGVYKLGLKGGVSYLGGKWRGGSLTDL